MKLVVSQFVTVDGVMEDPGGAEQFDRGGWAFQFERGEEGDRFKLDEVMASEALLLGRVTYEGFAAAWPSREGDFADKFNSMPKYVASTTLNSLEWSNSHLLEGDVVSAVESLKQRPGGDLLVNGSRELVQTLLDAGLVDEWRLMVFPVVLGAGKRLFGDTRSPQPLSLVDSRAVGGDGVVIEVYRPKEAPAPA